jgi:hypothetical protein
VHAGSNMVLLVTLIRRPKHDPPTIRLSTSPPAWPIINGLWLSHTVMERRGDKEAWTTNYLFGTSASTKKTTFKVAVANGPWTPLRGAPVQNGRAASSPLRFTLRSDPTYRFPKGVKPTGTPDDQKKLRSFPGFRVEVHVPKPLWTNDVRLVALTAKGKVIPAFSSLGPEKDGLPTKFSFEGKLSEVTRIELQIRPFEHIAFRGLDVQSMK